MPYFSVIMPLYNKASYVRRAVQSVVEQSFTDWELVVVDDGSTDGGGDLVAAMADSRIRLLRQENAGVSVARNHGVEVSAADSPYLCFLDADDWWDASFLEEVVGLVARYPDAGIYGTGYYLVKNGRRRVAPIGVEEGFVEGEINYSRVYARTLCMPLTSISVCMPRGVFAEVGGFPEGIAMGEDFLLWMQVALKHRVVLFNRPLSYYNQDVENTSRGIGRSYEPSRFMTFHFSRFAEAERKDADVKRLLDNLRVYTLMRFRRHNRCADEVKCEIAKVDFANVPPVYRFYYKAPYRLVASYLWMKETAIKIKNMNILKQLKNRLRGGVNVDKLVQRGLVLGKNCHLGSAFIDPSHCFHISIGDNVTFGPGVTVLAHDASTHTFLGYTRVADVKIGSNVFIGARSIVLPGVTIGDNVVVGAGSIISRDLPSGSVAVGAPARVVKELSAFLEAKKGEMRKENTFGEEHTLRNPAFGESQREALLRATKDYGCLYIE